MRNYIKWTESELAIIKKFYPSQGLQYLIENYGFDKRRLKLKINGLGLKLTKKAWKANHSTRHKKPIDAYKVDARKFMFVGTPEAAYLLGMIWADGSLDGYKYSTRIKLGIAIKDALELKKIFETTGLWNFITTKEKRYKTRMKRSQGVFDTSNFFLFNYLEEKNYRTKSKSASPILETIPEQFQHYWWRGFFDGDGCVTYNSKNNSGYNLNFAGPINQNWDFAIALFEKNGWSYHIHKRKHKMGNCSVFRCTKRADINSFGDFIYDSWKGGLSRKHKKYKQIIATLERLN